MSNTFNVSHDWNEFRNSWKLTDFQRYRIKRRYKQIVKEAIQNVIDESIEDRGNRRDDLNAHQDPDNPFTLDIGGEG
jgi:hypothetical protein